MHSIKRCIDLMSLRTAELALSMSRAGIKKGKGIRHQVRYQEMVLVAGMLLPDRQLVYATREI
jgi:hypothetical protein